MLIGGEFGSFPIKNVVLWEEAFISDTLAPKSAETLIKVVFNVLNRTGKKNPSEQSGSEHQCIPLRYFQL